ncbi:MAG: small acid-soluble spore protein Tlp [Bacillota bacterium]|nr:small acid-soluble spore protein Tlp [Bacillota bacterium]
MKQTPDDRRDNADKIQQHLENTLENIELTEETIAVSNDKNTKERLKDKNKKRKDAIAEMRQETQD